MPCPPPPPHPPTSPFKSLPCAKMLTPHENLDKNISLVRLRHVDGESWWRWLTILGVFFPVALPPELPVTHTRVNMTDILTLLVIHFLMCMVQMIYKDCLLPYPASHHLEPASPSACHVPPAVTARVFLPSGDVDVSEKWHKAEAGIRLKDTYIWMVLDLRHWLRWPHGSLLPPVCLWWSMWRRGWMCWVTPWD